MKSLFASFIACCVVFVALPGPSAVAAPTLELLHSFVRGGPADPGSDLTPGSDGNFYGTTSRGGAGDFGTVFKVTTAGVVTTLVEFTGNGAINKGASPNALVQGSDGSFYGTTSEGGAGDLGTVFKMTSAGAVTTLVQFTGNGAASKGSHPPAALVEGSDGNFYGTTSAGGANDLGTVFKVTPAGVLTTLVEFTGNGATNKGESPQAALLQGSDGNFYGTTNQGGASDYGTVFRVTSAGVLTTLVEFTYNDTINKGAYVEAGLVKGSDGNFYGTTSSGGASGNGTVFKMSPAGALTTLAEFTGNGAANKGDSPEAALVQGSDGNFYGTTNQGGASDYGTVFRVTSAGVLTTLVEFTYNDTINKGAYVEAGLVKGSDGNFYGTTSSGGASGNGTVFKMSPAGALTTLVEFTGNGVDNGGHLPTSLLQSSDGNFYGTTLYGGTGGYGTVFKITPAGALTTLVEFTGNGVTSRGRSPNAALVRGGDGNFYGTTSKGAASDLGTVFKMTPAGAVTTLVEFTGNGASNKGGSPRSALVQDGDGNFYGTTSEGGASDLGTVFKVTPAGALTTLVEFTGNGASSKGARPEAALVQGGDGNFYGTTSEGGAGGFGTVFKMTPAGVLTTLVEFTNNGATNKGESPNELVRGSDGNFYGTTGQGGVTGDGTAFKMTPAGALTTLVQFSLDVGGASHGEFPRTLVRGSDGNFYGTTGDSDTMLYQMTSTGALTTLLRFDGSVPDIGLESNVLVQGSDGNLYGTTDFGGPFRGGTIFRLRLTQGSVPVTTIDSGPSGTVNSRRATFSFSANVAGATFMASLDGGAEEPVTSPKIYTGLAQGAHSFHVRATKAGISDPTPAKRKWMVDTVAPDTTITFGPSGTLNGSEATFAFSSNEADVTFKASLDGAPEETVSSPKTYPGLNLGAHSFSVRAIDRAGNSDPTAATRSWAVSPGTPRPSRFITRATVPGAGSAGAPPADAALASLGISTIDDAGNMALVSKWTSASDGKGKGIFTDTDSVAEIGGIVPGIVGATFATLYDPVLDAGHVAFLATLAGVPAGNAVALFSEAPAAKTAAVLSDAPTGTLAVVARAGEAAPGADGAKFKSFQAVAVSGTGVAILGKLRIGSGSPAVTEANDVGLWAMDATHPLTLLLREGQTVGGQKIKALVSFLVGDGSPGQGRGWFGTPVGGGLPEVMALAFLSGKSRAVLSADLDGTVTTLSQSGPGGVGGPDIAGASFASYGVPAANANGDSAFRASLAVGAGGVTAANASGIFLRAPGESLYTAVVRKNDPAGTGGAKFGVLKDPVLASDGGIAFPATIKKRGPLGFTKQTLWWQPPGEALTLLAQAGANSSGIPGAKWEAFKSLAIAAGRGPIFVASLVVGKGGVTGKNATGVWAMDSTGTLQLLFRMGDRIDGKKVLSFNLLKAVPGSVGVTHSFNDNGVVTWLASFTDGTQAIMTSNIP